MKEGYRGCDEGWGGLSGSGCSACVDGGTRFIDPHVITPKAMEKKKLLL